MEVALIERLSKKALTYGQEISSVDSLQNGVEVRHKMDAKVVVEMYKNWVIPLTRHVEVSSPPLLSLLIITPPPVS